MKTRQSPALSNWSGDIKFSPAKVEAPRNERDLQNIIEHARRQGQTMRAIGAAHSCAPIVQTDQVIVSSQHFKGLLHHDKEKGYVTVGAGMTIEEIGECLFEIGLGMEN